MIIQRPSIHRFATKGYRNGLPTRSTDATLRQNTGACQWKLIAIAFAGQSSGESSWINKYWSFAQTVQMQLLVIPSSRETLFTVLIV